jgi:arylformamidase
MTATAQAETTRAKGPLVWLDMDQAALDAAYNQTVWAPNQDAIHTRRKVLAQETYARLKPQRLVYGESDFEGIDFYSCGKAGAPIMIFVHGGAWRAGRSTDFAHLADPALLAGAHFAALDFMNIDDAGGNLLTMAQQVRSAVAHIWRNAESLGSQQSRIFVSGHSSGGHLGGCVFATDWQRDFGLPSRILAGAVLLSGMYDLAPVRLSARSSYVKFTDETVEELSAIRHLDRINCPVLLGYGTLESPEFQRQTRAFHAALQAAGKPADLIVSDGANHFEVLEALHNPFGLFGRAARAMLTAAV